MLDLVFTMQIWSSSAGVKAQALLLLHRAVLPLGVPPSPFLRPDLLVVRVFRPMAAAAAIPSMELLQAASDKYWSRAAPKGPKGYRWEFAGVDSEYPTLVFSPEQRPDSYCKGRVWIANVDCVLNEEWLTSIGAIRGALTQDCSLPR